MLIYHVNYILYCCIFLILNLRGVLRVVEVDHQHIWSHYNRKPQNLDEIYKKSHFVLLNLKKI